MIEPAPLLARVEHGAFVENRGADASVPWWSFTKTVIAAAALVLVERGKLVLDDALPGRAFTLRQLLQHKAGVAEYGELPAYHEAVARGDAPWPIPLLLQRADADRLRYLPGQGWAYSNVGYLFAAQLIERAAGEDLGAALARLVLHPLGLEHARLARQPADLDGVAMGSAAGYHPGWVYHGLLAGPLREACLLLDRLMAGGLLAPRGLDEMRKIHVLGGTLPGRPCKTHGYGLGLMIGTNARDEVFEGHTGGGPGSMIAVYHVAGRTPRTAAAFMLGGDEGPVEALAFAPEHAP